MKKQILLTILAGSAFLAQANDTANSDAKEAAARQELHNTTAQHSPDVSNFLIEQCDKTTSQHYLFPAYMRVMRYLTLSPYSIKKGLSNNDNQFSIGSTDNNEIKYYFWVTKNNRQNNVTIKSHIECRKPECNAILEQIFAPAARRYMIEKTDHKIDWYEIKDRFTKCEEAVWKSGSFEGDNKWHSYNCTTEVPSDIL